MHPRQSTFRVGLGGRRLDERAILNLVRVLRPRAASVEDQTHHTSCIRSELRPLAGPPLSPSGIDDDDDTGVPARRPASNADHSRSQAPHPRKLEYSRDDLQGLGSGFRRGCAPLAEVDIRIRGSLRIPRLARRHRAPQRGDWDSPCHGDHGVVFNSAPLEADRIQTFSAALASAPEADASCVHLIRICSAT